MTTEPHVFFVDDNTDDLTMYDIVLKNNGLRYRASTRTDGEAALAFLKEAADKNDLPALVILDYNLPRINGAEVLAEMKQDPRLAKIPVIVISTSTSPSDITTLSSFSGVLSLTKPFSLEEFGPIVQAVRDRLPGPSR